MTLLHSFTQSFFLVPVFPLWRYAVLSPVPQLLLVYTATSTKTIFCLIKSFWLGFAGRQSWSFILDKTEYNLHPKDPILPAVISLLLRKRPAKTSAFGEVRRYLCPPWDKAVVLQELLGDLGWYLQREQVSKGDAAALLEAHLPSQFNLVLLWSDRLLGATVIFPAETMLSLGPSPSGRIRASGLK